MKQWILMMSIVLGNLAWAGGMGDIYTEAQVSIEDYFHAQNLQVVEIKSPQLMPIASTEDLGVLATVDVKSAEEGAAVVTYRCLSYFDKAETGYALHETSCHLAN